MITYKVLGLGVAQAPYMTIIIYSLCNNKLGEARLPTVQKFIGICKAADRFGCSEPIIATYIIILPMQQSYRVERLSR